MTIAAVIALLAILIIIGRLLTFRRGQSRHRRGVAITAWGLIAINAWLAMRIITSGEPSGWWLALVLVAIALLLLRCRGNLAHLIRWRH